MASVYWIHHKDHTDMFSHGYVGVSNNVERRFSEHQKQKENSHLHNAVKKYGFEHLVKSVLIIADMDYCLEVESRLRPEVNIGWNLAKGGGIPPVLYGNKYRSGKQSWNKGKKLSAEHVDNLSKAHAGQVAWNKGVQGAQTAWNKGIKISDSHKSGLVQKVVCPHCGKMGQIGGMARFHMDNCGIVRPYPARVTVNGKRIQIGRFKTKEEAKMAQLNYYKEQSL